VKPSAERGACIEADAGFACYERVIAEARIRMRVWNLKDIRAKYRVTAEGNIAIGFAYLDSDAALEPLPLGINQ
jgi:hypothetical protein